MLGGSGESKEEMSEEDLDATKEIISNISGAISNQLQNQNDLPKLHLQVKDIELIDSSGEFDIEHYNKMFIFAFKLNSIDSSIKLLIDSNIDTLKSAPKQASVETPTENLNQNINIPPSNVSKDEMKNISLILGVKLPIKVRIGSKKMLLKDVTVMDIGSIVELNQLANSPLDILIDNNVIAQGEVVIVDGNFGVQITSIGSKKDIMSKVKI